MYVYTPVFMYVCMYVFVCLFICLYLLCACMYKSLLLYVHTCRSIINVTCSGNV